jgi:hypothetical protein
MSNAEYKEIDWGPRSVGVSLKSRELQFDSGLRLRVWTQHDRIKNMIKNMIKNRTVPM